MINEKRVTEFIEFIRDERDSPIDHREAIGNMTNPELDFLIEWFADGLTDALAEKRRRR